MILSCLAFSVSASLTWLFPIDNNFVFGHDEMLCAAMYYTFVAQNFARFMRLWLDGFFNFSSIRDPYNTRFAV
ncbi:hypothetical protein F5B18DRAFT_645508 [Nemania serpens]|nr:hypothetical protein F5B18DRAFT_645508 [Nemania serpens]